MHHLHMQGNKMTSFRMIPIIIGVSINPSKIRDITTSRWTVVIDSITTMMKWMGMVKTQTKISILIKIKVWMEIIEVVSNNNRIKIIAINRTTTVINSKDLTNSKVEKFKYIILKLIGTRIQMLDQTQLRRLSNHNSLFQKRKIISHRLKIHKTIITFLRTITIFNNATELNHLITKVYPNNSNKDPFQNKIGNNL